MSDQAIGKRLVLEMPAHGMHGRVTVDGVELANVVAIKVSVRAGKPNRVYLTLLAQQLKVALEDAEVNETVIKDPL